MTWIRQSHDHEGDAHRGLGCMHAAQLAAVILLAASTVHHYASKSIRSLRFVTRVRKN